jgi:hypothetical protein
MGMMRRGATALTAVVVAGLILGCADVARGPTGPAQFGSPLFGVSANSASTVTTNDQVPFSFTAFVPCANGGAGEDVLVNGTLHILTHQTISNSGNVHVKLHSQPQGATGVGQTTGDTYHATGVTQEEINLNGPFPITDTFVNNFRIIGPGSNNNLLIHELVHVTINANGVLTAFVDNSSIECR